MTTVARYNGDKIENIINEPSTTTHIPKNKQTMSTTTTTITTTSAQQTPVAPVALVPLKKAKKTVYDKFMDAHYFDSKNKPTDPNASITNTRIGDKKNGLKGGNWYIPDDEYYHFLDLYYKDVIQTGTNEYLTEYQLPEGGPILIDVDLRHAYDVKTRQYNPNHIDRLVQMCAQILCEKVYQLDDEDHFKIYLLEKPTVNVVEKDKLTKDGVHLMIGVKSNPTVQQFLRQHLLEAIAEDPEWATLPITNSWDAVLDAGISGGKTNWQLYGSRKPDHQAYSLTAIYEVRENTEEGVLLKQVALSDFPLAKNIQQLSARYAHHPEFYHRSAYIQHLQGVKRAGPSSSSSSGTTESNNLLLNEVKNPANPKTAVVSPIIPVAVPVMTSKEDLDTWINSFLELNAEQYEVQDIYKFVLALPESYYGRGSYERWFRVGCSLKNHDTALFPIWVAFSSQSPTFDWLTGVEELWNKWNGMNQHDRLTVRSIKYWCRQENPEQYRVICEESADQLIESSLNSFEQVSGVQGMSHADIAMILYKLKKNEYVCSGTRSREWYKYNDNYWEKSEDGTDLRKFISDSNGLRGIYQKKLRSIQREAGKLQQGEKTTQSEMLENRIKLIQNIIQKLGDTNMKNNIMTEARELFYDAFFKDKLDTNKDLLCVKNGVLDFKEKVFRRGNPEDYLSMCTRSIYIPIQRAGLAKDYYENPTVAYENMSAKKRGFMAMDSNRCWVAGATDAISGAEGVKLLNETVADVHDFMEKIFTEPELREYMWQHLSSCLLGYTNQTFSMYIGKGSNGKSVLTKLMSDILGDYKGDVPLTLITEKRQKVGGLAPEIADLKGVRFALIQESSKGDALNEGIMKQLTSGVDVVQGRGLFQPSATKFYPQFKLAICSNEMLEVRSQDGGTWRRIRKIEYKSKFTDNPDPNNPREFKKISEIAMHHKMNDFWKSVFLSMLAEVAFKTMGQVEACSIVEEASRSYQESLDFMIGFMRDCVEVSEGGRITKTEINDEFARWFRLNNGGREPKPKEVHQQMDEHYGKYDGRKGWTGVRLKHVMEEDDEGGPDVEF